MLCLDENTPVIMALCLIGTVLFIVGGGLWGSGDYAGDEQKATIGIALLCSSIVLLAMAGIGCWCNTCFCTVDRKSKMAAKLYGKRRPAAQLEEAEERKDMEDWEEYGGSFRSLRSSRRSLRRSRRDRVQPETPPVPDADLPPAHLAPRQHQHQHVPVPVELVAKQNHSEHHEHYNEQHHEQHCVPMRGGSASGGVSNPALV